MLKKFMTGLIAITLMAGASGTITSFADYEEGVIPEQTTERKDGGFKQDRMSLFGEKGLNAQKGIKAERAEKGSKVKLDKKNMTEEERQASKEEREAKRNETLNAMYPEIVETHTQLKADLDSSKETVKSIKDQIDAIVGVDKEAQKAEHMAFMESIKTKLDSKEITREEAKLLFDEYRETQKAAHEALFKMSDENKAKLEEIRVQFASFKDDRALIAKELKVAIDAEDSAAFKVAFDKIMAILETTNSLEKEKILVLTDVLNNLQ